MSNPINIEIVHCNILDAMGLDNDAAEHYDIPASTKRFKSMLQAAVEADYPYATVTITGDPEATNTWVHGVQPDDAEYIRSLAGDIFGVTDWLVAK